MRYNDLQIPTAIRPNAKLGKLTVSRIGKYFAYDEDLDGYSSVEVKPQQLTATERDFLCGNALKRTLVLDEDVTFVVTDVSACFPNLSTVVVSYEGDVVTGLDVLIGDLQDVTCIVPNSLISFYRQEYPALTFDSWVLDVVFTIPYIGESELTADYVRTVAEVASGSVETVTKVIVPPEFTSFETGVFDLIWALFVNCGEIEYYEPRLPAEYQEVEYIESTGTQWIQCNETSYYLINSGTLIHTKSSTNVVAPYKTIFGFNNFEIYYDIPNISIWTSGTSGQIISGQTSSLTVGTAYEHTVQVSSGTSQNVTIFSYLGKYNLNGRIYYFIIENQGNIVRNLVPCYRKLDGEIGLYDIVNDVFYTNQGTGVFLKGNDTNTYDGSITLTRPSALTCTIVGSGTLTAQNVTDTLAKYPELVSAEKVIVPVEFTAYESGSINAIGSNFSQAEEISVQFNAGDVNFAPNGDVVSKINELGRNIEGALTYAKQYESSHTSNYTISADANLVILPPLNVATTINAYGLKGVNNYPNLVYADIRNGKNVDTYSISESVSLVEMHYRGTFKGGNQAFSFTSMKRCYIEQTGLEAGYVASTSMLTANDNLEVLLMTGCTIQGSDISRSTKLTRQAFIDLFNSLGTPSTTQTIVIGADNIAKLTEDDIALAQSKNWNVVAVQ